MELISETAVGCTTSYFVKIIWCSCWFCNPPPLFWGWILLILWSPAEGWLLLDIGWFVLFLYIWSGYKISFNIRERKQMTRQAENWWVLCALFEKKNWLVMALKLEWKIFGICGVCNNIQNIEQIKLNDGCPWSAEAGVWRWMKTERNLEGVYIGKYSGFKKNYVFFRRQMYFLEGSLRNSTISIIERFP